MILFVGSEEKGYFIRDIADKHGWRAAFVKQSLSIESQVKEILSCQDCKFVIYDIEQYAEPAEEIASVIHRVQLANNAEPVIFAPGYNPQSDMIMYLTYQEIRNYIFGDSLSDKKEELERCIRGDYESMTDLKKNFEPQQKEELLSYRGTAARSVGIAGAVQRMGTTTQAIQFVKYLMLKGYRACYIQMNNHGWIEELAEAYEDVAKDGELGKAVYQGVEMFYKLEKLPEVLKQGYDYYIYDYGVYSERDFNKVSFLEKDLQIFVVGTKPGEFMKTYDLIENNFYNNVIYIFNFIRDDKTEHEDTYELMHG